MRHFMRSSNACLGRALTVLCVAGLVACGKVYVEEEVPNTFELSQGTPMHVELVNPPRASELTVGQVFDAVLAKPIYYSREKLDPQGNIAEDNIAEEMTLVAPVGAPVAGVAVAQPSEERDVGLQVTSITFHGGMSFPVETIVLKAFPADERAGEILTFELSEPADAAMALNYRYSSSTGAED